MLKRNGGDTAWECAADAGGGGNSFETWDAPAGTDPVADSSTDTMELIATAPITITGDSSLDRLTFDVADAVAGAEGVLRLAGDLGGTAAAPTVLGVQVNSVALTGDTTGNYVDSATSSQGLLLTGTEGASLGFIDCAANQVLKRNGGDTAWECAADAGGGGNSFETWDAPAGTDPVADSSTDTMELIATAPITITGDSSLDRLTFDVADAVAGAEGVLRLAGDLGGTAAAPTVVGVQVNSVALSTDTTGNYVDDITASQGLLLTGTEGATLGLIDCAANEVLARNGGDTAWVCLAGAPSTDADAIHDNVASEISAITAKATLVAGDFLVLEDSAAANVKKSVTFTALEDSLDLNDIADAAGGHLLISNILGSTKGDLIVGDGTEMVALGVGTTNLPLVADSGAADGIAWKVLSIVGGGTGASAKAGAFNNLAPGTTTGDLIVNTGAMSLRLPIGSNGEALVADSGEALGLKWAALGTVKSGTINVTEGTPGTVTFTTAFGSTPFCTCTLAPGGVDFTCWQSTDASTTAVSWAVDNSTGGTPTLEVQWICTNAGDS